LRYRYRYRYRCRTFDSVRRYERQHPFPYLLQRAIPGALLAAGPRPASAQQTRIENAQPA
jgi:hypothetical protein